MSLFSKLKWSIASLWIVITILPPAVLGQQSTSSSGSIIYKTVNDTTKLSIHFTYPETYQKKAQWPLIIFYYGGGWNSGSYEQFLPQARYFSKLGFVCALPDYRVHNIHGSTPFDALMDAKSAVRFVKEQAKQLRIDTSKVIAAGGSAGGHLAAAIDLVKGYNDPDENMQISTEVNALVLFNPVLDNGPDGYGYRRIGKRYQSFSPYHQPKRGAPPTLIMLGTQDKLIPVKTMEEFCLQLKTAGIPCKLVLYEGQEHGFFNREPYLSKTINAMENFLHDQGFLN